MTDLIIRQFERKDQQEVALLYQSGMGAYADIPIICDCTAWFVKDKLQLGGDMSNIYLHYIQDLPNRKKRNFWVAELNGSIVGVIGAIPSTKYSEDCVELVRMSVSPNSRKIGVGSRLIKTLEDWAITEGYKLVNLSTLEKMYLAVQLYTKNGYTLREKESFDAAVSLNLPEPAPVTVNHFVKELVA
jgi:GNAT superfamily N-acetyltransferase